MKNLLINKKIILSSILSIFVIFSLTSISSAASNDPRVTFTINDSSCPSASHDNCTGISSASVRPGYITLRWRGYNVSSCSASASGNSSEWSGSKDLDGTKQIFSGLPGTINYSINCVGINGRLTSDSVMVNILPTPTDNNSSNPSQPQAPSQAPAQTPQDQNVDSNSAGPGSSEGAAPSVPASPSCNFGQIKGLSALVTELINCMLTPIAYLLVGLALVIFVFGVFKFIRSEGEDKQGGRELMFWGIVGLFVMVSLWGLVGVLKSTFVLKL